MFADHKVSHRDQPKTNADHLGPDYRTPASGDVLARFYFFAEPLREAYIYRVLAVHLFL